MGSTIQSRHNEVIRKEKERILAEKNARNGHILKDMSIVADVRLDRLVQFDERSRGYGIMAAIGTKSPRSYTWHCDQVLDQGPDGACVGFGVAHELIARPAEVKGITDSYAKTKIYWEAQKIDPWIGGSYPGANPFYEGTSVLAGAKIAKKLGWIDEYRWAFGVEELKLGVGYNGPAVVGIPWYIGMFYPDSNNYIHPTGSIAGGHCVLVNSINVKENRFTIHNSWGSSWGKNGEVYISFNDMDKLLRSNGEACFFLHRHNKQQL